MAREINECEEWSNERSLTEASYVDYFEYFGLEPFGCCDADMPSLSVVLAREVCSENIKGWGEWTRYDCDEMKYALGAVIHKREPGACSDMTR